MWESISSQEDLSSQVASVKEMEDATSSKDQKESGVLDCPLGS
jgi:hypothetical protein